MKKLISLYLSLTLLLLSFLPGAGFAAQAEGEAKEDPITFYVGLGNGKAYYEALKEAIKEKLGIEIQLIYQSAIDTTSATWLEFKNNELPADIVATASRVPQDYLGDSCLDLMSYTHLTDLFTYQKVDEYTNADGSIYQLPFSSKLLGITYNKTLMEENGWDVPESYADMLELKKQCDEKGILFAVSANVATGHGFNFFFHLMGADWLSTLEGSNWLNHFLKGEEDATRLKERGSYFAKWVQNGLFGSIHAKDWNSRQEYSSRRALFFFDLANAIYSYEGEMVDENGNSTGVMLQDEYASMPWISEDGSNNCFAYYDCMILALNKKLAAPEQAEKLENICRILEFMTTEEVTSIFTESSPDAYVAVNSFIIDESRAYYRYKEAVETGYVMPWYYSEFDMNTIINTGEVINDYMRGAGSSYEDILAALEKNNSDYLQQEIPVLTRFEANLSYEETARLDAIASILSLQNELDQKGIAEKVTVGLTSYVSKLSDHQPFTTVGTLSNRAYAGDFIEINAETIISAKAQNVVGVYFSGKRLKEIAAVGLQDGAVVYPYVMYSTEAIEDDKTYLVAVSLASLNEDVKTEVTESRAILQSEGANITAKVKWGVVQFLQGKESIGAEDLVLEAE